MKESEIIFERKFYKTLLQWKESNGKKGTGRKSLLVEGARRIGKSTIVKHFADNEYDSYIVVDFSVAGSNKVRELFENHMDDLDDFFTRLSDTTKTTLYPGKSVIVLDEIQQFPLARQRIKTLVDDGRYDYIETGSLISIKENIRDIVVPDNEHSVKMYPMDFEEFCWAIGEKNLCDEIREHYFAFTPLDDEKHNRAMDVFRRYLLIGGMPQSVKAYINDKTDLTVSDGERRDILDLYGKDIDRVPISYRAKVKSIYDQIPGFLSRHEKRVKFTKTSKGKPADTYEETFFWLEDSMVCNMCFKCNDPNTGLSIDENRTYVKCYMGDTGLLFSHAFDENATVDNDLLIHILKNALSVNKGMLYENAIAQMLVCSGHRLFFYTHYNKDKSRNDIEIDFIITANGSRDSKIVPIDVKSSSTKIGLVSLNRFRETYADRISHSVVIYPKNLRIDEEKNILYIPSYMTFCL